VQCLSSCIESLLGASDYHGVLTDRLNSFVRAETVKLRCGVALLWRRVSTSEAPLGLYSRTLIGPNA
jgi:hypothetical protein